MSNLLSLGQLSLAFLEVFLGLPALQILLREFDGALSDRFLDAVLKHLQASLALGDNQHLTETCANGNHQKGNLENNPSGVLKGSPNRGCGDAIHGLRPKNPPQQMVHIDNGGSRDEHLPIAIESQNGERPEHMKVALDSAAGELAEQTGQPHLADGYGMAGARLSVLFSRPAHRT